MTTTTTQTDQTTVTTSKFMRLNLSDFQKSLLMAVGVPVLYLVQQSLDAGSLNFNWKQLEMAAISGLVTYLIKNFFTASKTVVIPEVKTPSVITPETPATEGTVIPLKTDDPKAS